MSDLDTAADEPGAVPHDTSDPYERAAQTFPRLDDEQIARASTFGRVEDVPQGAVLFRPGDHTVDFFIVQAGTIEIFDDDRDGAPHVIATHRERQFTGELDLFNDRAILVGGRMGTQGRVARLTRPQFRRLLAAEPDIGETIMRAFILRRVAFIQHGQAAATLLESRSGEMGEALRIQRFLNRNAYPVVVIDVDRDENGRAMMATHGLATNDLPAVIAGRARILKHPSNVQLGDALGITEPIDPAEVLDLAVVGAGPSGLAAAVYAASEGLRTLVLEAEAPGGQAATSSKIENYLGFPTGISGMGLAGRAQVQAQKFGARIAVPRRVEHLDCGAHPFRLALDDGSVVQARTVVIATGARYRTLDNVENFDRFAGGNGVHWAATAMEAALCEREEVIVVGGGNSAGQAALFISRHAAHVHMLVRGAGLAASMSDYLVGRIEASDRITLHTECEIVALSGDRHLERVRWADRRTGETTDIAAANVFLMLGAVPNTEWLGDCAVKLDANGFVSVGGGNSPLETSVPGIFAVGDVRAGSVKRVASAVGEGSVVVSSVHQALAG